MERNEKLAVAATLINEIMNMTTDATRMDVVVAGDESIDLFNKPENAPVFYHAEKVTDVCRVLGLSHWVSADINNYKIKIRVHIF